MRSSLAVITALVLSAVPAAADPVRVVAADDRGVTLELTVPAYRLGPPREDGRSELIVPGLHSRDIPGRPLVPVANVLVALPPGASARASVIGGAAEEMRGDVRLAIAEKSVFRDDRGGFGPFPAREPVAAILDGPWPREGVTVGEPFTLRRQRLVAVEIQPFRYDAAEGRLWSRRSMIVRVEFVGGAAAPGLARATGLDDAHADVLLRAGVVNYQQGRGWREPARPAIRRDLSGLTPSSPRFGGAAAAGVNAPLAFDESSPEVRVKIDTTGVYMLPYATLASNGYPPLTPIAQVSVHRHEFMEGSTPPYATVELPIEVVDHDGDGIFNGTDSIVVFVQSWAERSRASWAQRAWGDAEVIYATAVSGAGLRLPTRPGWRNTPGLTPLATYPWKQRWEKNYNYFTFPPDTLSDQFTWTEIMVYYSRDDTLRFETNHLDPTHDVTVSLSWNGRLDAPHFTWAQYRNGNGPFVTVADSMGWYGRVTRTATVTLPGSTLGEGNVNTVRQWGKTGSGPPDPNSNFNDNVGLNWIEASYWRRYQPLANYLSCNSGDASGEIQISAPGFARADIRVYDVTDSLNPVRLTLDPSHIFRVGSPYTIEFQDSVAAGSPRQYVVFSRPKTPPAANFSAVTREQLTARSRGNYLLIVPEAFRPAMDRLIVLRQSQGFDVVVAPFEALCDEFNGGRKSSYAIKRFTRYAFENWDAKFVLLVGDGSEDPLNTSRESSPDWIPAQKINGPVVIQYGYEIIPCDPWYVCMANCDYNSFIPALQDMAIGRLPVQRLDQAQAAVDKIVDYETVAPDQTWRRNILLNSDDDYSSVPFFGGGGGGGIQYCRRPGEKVFEAINNTVADVILNRAGLQQAVIDTLNLSTFLEGVGCTSSVPGDTCACKDEQTLKQITHGSVTGILIDQHLNPGRLWWNFQGHANDFVLTHENMYVNAPGNDDKDLLLNDSKPFLFSAFSCHANAFGRYGDQAPTRGSALGEEMVLLPSRGAIASWASTGYEILPFSGTSHINVELARALFEDPPHDTLGTKGARVLLGQAIGLALIRYVPGVLFNPNERGIGMTYHLIGDPATPISIGEPQSVVLANQVPVVDAQPVRLHTVGDTLRLEADLVSNVELTQIALERNDASGTQVIPSADYSVTPTFPDTLPGGLGGRHYHLSYGTLLHPDSYSYTFRTLDRAGVPGDFDVAFQFLTQLRVDDVPITDGDPVSPTANLALRVFSPKPLVPLADLTLTVNGVTQPFTPTPVAGDVSGREWTLSWTHPAYPIDDYDVQLSVNGGGAVQTRRFVVSVGPNELQLRNLVAFPNPFDDEGGTAFSFLLISGSSAVVQIRVFTPSGRLVYERLEAGLAPGYHQLAWDGRDAEGDKLANGVYIYRAVVGSGGNRTEQTGRLVKLRRPRRAAP